MDAEELAFVTAIVAAPADDTPRLVFADWLDEHDRPERAEFVRAQCELAKMPEPELKTVMLYDDPHASYPGGVCYACRKAEPRWCEYHTLQRRATELLDARRGEWFPLGGVRPWSNAKDDVVWATGGGHAGTFYAGGEVSRGFVSHLTCSAADWLRYADALHWHPSQTDQCPRCVTGVWHKIPLPPVPCPDCVKGRVPRPCPPTAQPIEAVTLTEMGVTGYSVRAWGGIVQRADLTFTSARWPGVTFRLPRRESVWGEVVGPQPGDIESLFPSSMPTAP
jgi:uncharacterized protein (TIGR02996 family)